MEATTTKTVQRRLTVGKRCVFAMLPLFLLLTLAELAARWLVSDAVIAKRFEQIEQIVVFLGNEPGESFFQPDPDCFWRLKPNVVAPIERGNWWGGMMSNSHGMRSREVSVAETQDKLRVLCFGDSTTFAFGVDFAEAWPNQLQTLLDQEAVTSSTLNAASELTRSVSEGDSTRDFPMPSLTRRVSNSVLKQPLATEVLNAGIPGQTSYQGRKRLLADLQKWRPHLTVITFGNNDGWRWDGLADKDHASVSSSFATKWLNHSRALSWLQSCRLPSAQQQTTNHESRWAEQATQNYFDPNMSWTPRVSLDDFADNLRAMIELCHQRESEVVLIVWPDQRQLLNQPTWRLPYQAAMRQVAQATNTPCIDLVPLFEDTGQWGVARFLPRDVIHVDRAGNELVRDAVAAHVRRVHATVARSN